MALALLVQLEGDAVDVVMANAENLEVMLQPMYKELQVSSSTGLGRHAVNSSKMH